jgi:hypothetical protein
MITTEDTKDAGVFWTENADPSTRRKGGGSLGMTSEEMIFE